MAAAGDIACDPESSEFNDGNGEPGGCRMKATSDLLVRLSRRGLDAVLTLGDNQYEEGTLEQFQQSYDATWGRLKKLTRPAPGNHDYETGDAAGYFAYFGSRAGDPEKGYYSFDTGEWHAVVLNSNCGEVGGCEAGSPQERWLRADLQASPAGCTLAYWHHPRFTSGPHGNDDEYVAFWRALYDAGADVVLVGHDHLYERFAPQDPDGRADPERGIRQFTVGTGGKSLYPVEEVHPNSEVRSDDAFGVLLLTLHPESYEWEFLSVGKPKFTDSGRDSCV